MKFGVFDHVDCSGDMSQNLSNRLEVIEVYDRCGLHGYHVAEHHGTTLGCAPSPSLLLAAATQRTKRMKIGPLVYLLPLYEPLRLIEEICMLDHMSHGRLMLGIGRGASPYELGFYGIDAKESGTIFNEVKECLLKGLQDDILNFEGEHFRYDNVPMILKPVQKPHPELWYGVQGVESAVWAAANGINMVTLALDDGARTITDAYRGEWQRLGRDEKELPLMGVSRHIVVAPRDAEAKTLAREAYAHWLESFDSLWRQRGPSVRELVPSIGALYPDSWDELEAMGNGFAGNPDAVQEYLAREIERTGINYVVAWFAFGNLTVKNITRSVELFSSHVMPAIDRLTSSSNVAGKSDGLVTARE